jgi:hypothetical protein
MTLPDLVILFAAFQAKEGALNAAVAAAAEAAAEAARLAAAETHARAEAAQTRQAFWDAFEEYLSPAPPVTGLGVTFDEPATRQP